MPVRSLCFSPNSQLLITASDDKDMKIYDVLANSALLEFFITSSLLCCCPSNHGALASTLSGHTSWVLSVAFSPDNQHVVTG